MRRSISQASTLPLMKGCCSINKKQKITLACFLPVALAALFYAGGYCAEEGACLSVSSILFQRQRRVILQKSDGAQLVFCMEKNKRLSVGQNYRVYLPVSTVVSELKKAYLPQPCALAVEKIEATIPDLVEVATENAPDSTR